MPTHSLDGVAPKLPAQDRHWIAPGAHVIGKVTLGLDVGIWFGATLRGDNERISVGDRSNVQEGCTLHTDWGFPLEIGADCTIGHGAILHGCRIGPGSLVGMGAVVLNGAEIGEGSLVGARALVTERKAFPPRSLIVGSPAKALRTLTDEEVAGLLLSAAGYVANWKRFAKGLAPTGPSPA